MQPIRVNTRNLLLAIAAFALSLSLAANAAVPTQLNYQGRLEDSGGNPLDGTYVVIFTIYDADVAGNVLWSETQSSVAVSNGLFATQLGTVNPLPASVFETEFAYLGITVGTDPEMTPRQRIVASAYAKRIETVDGASGGRIDGNLRLTYPGAPVESPLAQFQIETEDIGLTSSSLEADRVVVEAADAVLGLYSTNTGLAGSGLAFGEVEGGVLNDKWGFIRQTSSAGGAFALTYGSTASIYSNYPVLVMKTDGMVGVGSSAPDATLNVKGGRWNLDSGEGDFKIGNGAYRFKIGVATGGGGAGIVRMRSAGGAAILALGSDSNDVLAVNDKSVAINSLDPTNPLTVYGEGTTSGALFSFGSVVARFRNTNSSEASAISVDAPPGKDAALVFAEDGVGKAGLYLQSFDSQIFLGTKSNFEIHIDGQNHKVGIGVNPYSNPERLQVGGDLRADNICYSGSIGACSDRRFKKNIKPLSGSLDKIESLRPVNYEWRRDEFPNRGFGDGNQIGLIAQEVKDIIPEVVIKQGDGYYSVDYSRLTPVLIDAVKELNAKLDAQSERIDKLLATIARQNERLNQLSQNNNLKETLANATDQSEH